MKTLKTLKAEWLTDAAPLFVQLANEIDQLLDATAQAIQFPNDQSVALA